MNILLLEDDDADKLLVQVALSRSGLKVNLIHVKTIAEGYNYLKNNEISLDCALLDCKLPDGNGIDFRNIDKLKEIPCIILTGYADEDLALLALQRGFEDYILKDTLNQQTLSKAIRYAIERNNIKQQLLATQKKLEDLVRIDPLTGALNRRGLTEILNRLKGRENTHGIILVDLDKFKHINDTYGYDAGDAALKLVTNKLTLTARPLDQVARIGGDEFIVLVQNVDLPKCLVIAERIRIAIEGIVLKIEEKLIPITASIGVATLDTAETVEDLLKVTQKALHKSKQGGRNVVCN